MGLRRFTLLAACCATLLAGCGAEENPRLLAGTDADALAATAGEVRSAIEAGECRRANRRLDALRGQVADLPDTTARRLRENLEGWIAQADARLGEDCQEEPEETPTPDETETPAPTAAPPEPTAEPTPAPTEEPTPDPTEEPPPEEPGNGNNGNGNNGNGNGNNGQGGGGDAGDEDSGAAEIPVPEVDGERSGGSETP